jgi:hypothetical protein
MLGFDALGREALGQLPGGGGSATVYEDSWHQAFATDTVRRRPPYGTAQHQFASFIQFAPFAGVFTPAISQWAPQLSEPTRRRKPMHTGSHQFAAFVEFAPFPETVSADRWFVPFSEPVRFRPRLTTANQWHSVGIEFPLTTIIVGVRATLLVSSSLTGIPTSNYKRILTTTSRLVYAAEISPWTVSDRNS